MQHSWNPWWTTDEFTYAGFPVHVLDPFSGPRGTALVKVWPDGRTQPGWGLQPEPGFMHYYNRGAFRERRALYGVEAGKWAYALVMRSLRLVCIDIDGKNGGLEYIKRLAPLPRTFAETSKSGNGYHLFYVVDQEWDPQLGYGLLGDRIGIETGVDFRGTGCVYHYASQRWNMREPVALPDHLHELLQHRETQARANAARVASIIEGGDAMELLALEAELRADLMKPIKPGHRNNTLFAIGSKMKAAGLEDWDRAIEERARALKLDTDEIEKLIRNIENYA